MNQEKRLIRSVSGDLIESQVDPSSLMALPDSLSGWRVVKMEPGHRTGTRLGALSVVYITLVYPHANGEYVSITVMIESKERLLDLVPFLQSAQNLPSGIRIDIARTKHSPYAKPPSKTYRP